MAWLTWIELQKISSNRNIVFFGRSEDWVPKCLPYVKPKYIVDSNKVFMGESFYGVLVKDKDEIKKSKNKPFIVITSSAYEEIGAELEDNDFKASVDYCYCPEFYDYRKLLELKNTSFKLIFSSSDYSSGKATRISKAGGGLFLMTVENGKVDISRKVSGQYRQFQVYDDKIIAVDNYAALNIFDLDFNLINTVKLPHSQCCGVTVGKNGIIYVSNSSTDIIYLVKDQKKVFDEIHFGYKSGKAANSYYHINDITFSDDTLFVSYFSKSGYWKKDVFDGGVDAIDLKSKNHESLYKDLWQPHSPEIINGNLHILDSSNGFFFRNNVSPSGSFSGFVRGLKYANGLYFIGQSETMYMSRKKGLSNNIMTNAGIYIFDNESKASRFYSIYDNCNIHDIHILNCNVNSNFIF